ncbi:MAG TPA: transglycosylase SLT domain-containing protein [Trebonia sp.]|nr:transglycosylase SLT domain-containing protein [Trebonia sp.]
MAAPVSRATSTDAVTGHGPVGRASSGGSSSGGSSSDTGPLPRSRSARRKKGLFRRSGIIFPAIVIAALIVAIVAVASYLMSPNGRGATGLAPVFDTLTHSKSIALLESERQQLIVMNAAAGTLSDAAKPSKVSPSAVMASAAAASAAENDNNSADTGSSGTGSSDTGSSDSGSQQVVQAAPPDQGTAQQIGYDMLPSYGYNQSSEWTCLKDLWNQESGWRYDAENPSGAYGIPQSLPGDKMASAGADWETDPTTQIKWGLGYIKSIYGTPCGAWDHEVDDGWY